MDKALREAAAALQPLGRTPKVGVVLGSGLGAFVDALGEVVRVPYAQIPHLPRSSVPGHAGNLCLGRVGGTEVACLQGRVHLYEGHEPDRVVFGVRLLAELGCRAVLLTNAAGGIAESLVPGALLLIADHLNLTGRNPLSGPDDPASPRFVDLTVAYDLDLRRAAHEAAASVGVALHEGVYAAVLGPSYETPAEIRMLRMLGADAVGMSTVPEVIALRQREVRVGAMSLITNLAAGLGDGTLTHEEVQQTADRARASFTAVLKHWVMGAAEL